LLADFSCHDKDPYLWSKEVTKQESISIQEFSKKIRDAKTNRMERDIGESRFRFGKPCIRKNFASYVMVSAFTRMRDNDKLYTSQWFWKELTEIVQLQLMEFLL